MFHGKLLFRTNDSVHICFNQLADKVNIAKNVSKTRNNIVKHINITYLLTQREGRRLHLEDRGDFHGPNAS